jgi:hypothetical protein
MPLLILIMVVAHCIWFFCDWDDYNAKVALLRVRIVTQSGVCLT